MTFACADNLKVTFPIAAATFQMAWGIASLPGSGAGVDQQVFAEMRWATDFLLACFNGSSLVTQACLSTFTTAVTHLPLVPFNSVAIYKACILPPKF